MNRLEQLCHPLLALVCQYCCFSQSDASIKAEDLQWKIKACLNEIRTKCEEDPALKREFTRIEQPLVFFIDYTIKEGHFPFSNEWSELAREYNELSGDEKFFDLLANTLEDPDASDRLKIFYIMMGLGFDGCYKNDQGYIERRMKLCATRFQPEKAISANELFADAENAATHRRSRFSWVMPVVVVLSLAFFGEALFLNCKKFFKMTNAFYSSVSAAANNAMSLNMTMQNKAAVENMNETTGNSKDAVSNE